MQNVNCGMCGCVVAKLVKGSQVRTGTFMHCGDCVKKCRAIVAGEGEPSGGISIFNDAAMKEAKILDEEGK